MLKIYESQILRPLQIPILQVPPGWKSKHKKGFALLFFCSLIMMVLTWKGKRLWIYWPDSWWSWNIIQSWQSTCFFFYVQKKIVHYPFYSHFKNHALYKFTQEPGYLMEPAIQYLKLGLKWKITAIAPKVSGYYYYSCKLSSDCSANVGSCLYLYLSS